MSEFESKITKEAKKKINKTKETEMKTSNWKQTTITVIITLVAVAALGGAFYQGSQFGAAVEKQKSAEVHEQVKALATVVSKTDQQ